MSLAQQALDYWREIDGNYKIYFLINEREQTVYILRVFHILVDSREEILRIIA